MPDVADRAAQARTTCPFLTAKQAAFHLGLAASSLKGMRAKGRGPRCRLHGRAWYYHIEDLEAWSAAHAKGGGDA
ncbi:MAG TPA: helix-turn-helix domain-containing protein [Sphingomonas sp.]